MTRQRGKSWVADGVNKHGKRERLSFPSEDRAKRYERDHLSFQDQNQIGLLFPTWADEIWLGTKNEYEALGLTRRVIKKLGPKTAITAIDRPMIKTLSATLKAEGVTQSTVNRYLSCLSKLLKYALDEEVLTELPTIKLKQDKDARRFRILTYEEEDKMFACFESEADRHFANFLLYTGMRNGETERLTWLDVAHNARTLTIWKSKTGKPRTIPLCDEAFAALEYTRRLGWERPWEHIEYRRFLDRWHAARKAAGLDDEVIPYTCRHTCATRLALGGMDVFRLMEWMGHANIATTRLYVQLNTANLDQGVSILTRRKAIA